MVGLIPKVLLDLAVALGGEQAAAAIRERAGVPPERRYRLGDVYADDEWQRLLAAACLVFDLPQDRLEQVYAAHFLADAVRRWPVWFQMSSSARQFLERQPTIHNTFATGARDPATRRGIEDKFRLEARPNEIIAHYRSPNLLCGLYRALAQAVLDHYGERAAIDEPRCLKRGDAECEIHVRWDAELAP